MAKNDLIQLEGEVVETLPDERFRVEVVDGHLVLCTLAGRLRYRLSIARGDRVAIEMSRHDLEHGRVVDRLS